MNLYLVFCLILLAHFIGDFIFQSQKMAENKSNNDVILSQHCFFYSIPFFFLSMFFEWDLSNKIFFGTEILLSHFIIDYISSKFYKNTVLVSGFKRMFFIDLGFDQLLHIYSALGLYFISGKL